MSTCCISGLPEQDLRKKVNHALFTKQCCVQHLAGQKHLNGGYQTDDGYNYNKEEDQNENDVDCSLLYGDLDSTNQSFSVDIKKSHQNSNNALFQGLGIFGYSQII